MIYLDHAAATPVHPKALSAMLPYFDVQFFNPSAPYLPAKRVREAYNAAKDQIAHCVGAKGSDLIITAGATESINLAFTACSDGAILTLPTEHAAVLEAAKAHQVSFVAVDRSGLIDPADFRAKLTDDIGIVSISLANNELGTIQPIADIAEIIRSARRHRLERGITRPLYLHSDASQALNLLDLNVSRMGIDLLTLNAAKCGGPKGVGALYSAHGIRLHPLTVGGGQERGLRSGTENVAGVIGFATAFTEAKEHLNSSRKQYQKMASTLREGLSYNSIVAHIPENVKHKLNPRAISEPIFLGNPKHQLANFVPICFPGLDAERLIYKLEAEEIYLSTGAACAANKGSKSHVLAAIGLSDPEIAGSIRISLGNTNTPEQIEQATKIIRQAVIEEYARTVGLNQEKGGGGIAKEGSFSLMERIKERPAGREEGAPREDGHASGSRSQTKTPFLGDADPEFSHE